MENVVNIATNDSSVSAKEADVKAMLKVSPAQVQANAKRDFTEVQIYERLFLLMELHAQVIANVSLIISAKVVQTHDNMHFMRMMELVCETQEDAKGMLMFITIIYSGVKRLAVGTAGVCDTTMYTRHNGVNTNFNE